MHTRKRLQAILSAILITIMGPGYGLAWEIQTPGDLESFGREGSIGGESTGPANAGFVFRVRQGGSVVASSGGTVNAYEQWGATIAAPTNGFNCGAANLEIAESNITKDSVEITFNDSGCG